MGLLTFLRNFLFPRKSKKSITKVSKRRTRKRVRKTPAKVKPVKLEEFEYDTIEFDINDTVSIEHDIDKVLDFLNSFPDELKQEVMQVLEKKEDAEHDKALFLTGMSSEQENKLYYMVLCKVVTLDEKGLMLIYSTNLDLLSLYISNMTTMPYEKVKQSFKEKD